MNDVMQIFCHTRGVSLQMIVETLTYLAAHFTLTERNVFAVIFRKYKHRIISCDIYNCKKREGKTVEQTVNFIL